ncbi:hypothetical protein DLH72_05015 [Candidatus Gracilibacteria bacterium]|nr:MAG: hypothetical protein DLH72_05015 [Candidatus Gracilibacteria bacterium]
MLKKEITTQYGAKAQYWAISKIEIDRINLGVTIELFGYVSKEAEKQKMTHIDSRTFYVSFIEEIQETELQKIIPDQLITPEVLALFHQISLMAYSLVKKSEEFNDSEDDLVDNG